MKDKVLYYYFDREPCRTNLRAVFRSKPDIRDEQFFSSNKPASFTFSKTVTGTLAGDSRFIYKGRFFEVAISDGSTGYIRDIFFKSEDVISKDSLQTSCLLSLSPEQLHIRLDQYIGLEQQENLRRNAALQAKRQEEEEAKRNRVQRERVSVVQATRYVAELQAKYRGRLTFGSIALEKYINDFNIDCRVIPRRVPLRNILLARIAQGDTSKEVWLSTHVLSIGRSVRIFDQLQRRSGAKIEPAMVFEINDWGELRGVGISSEELLNTCFGSYGPIWKD